MERTLAKEALDRVLLWLFKAGICLALFLAFAVFVKGLQAVAGQSQPCQCECDEL